MTLKSSSYLLPKFSRVPLTIVLIRGISIVVNGTLLNFAQRYEDNLRVIFDQWPKLHLGLDGLSNQKILNCIYYTYTARKHTDRSTHGDVHIYLLVFQVVV